MKKVDGFWYPDSEERLHRNHSSLWSLEKHILPYVDRRGLVATAGAAVGAWPVTYGKHFTRVVAFEPNRLLWPSLERNLLENGALNVEIVYAGLSNKYGECEMVDVQPNNMGAWHIQPGKGIPMIPLDAIELEECDLLQLDVEGGEIDALEGAKATIAQHKPVIVVEVKPATLRQFKQTTEELYTTLRRMGYHQADRFARDELWLPN